VYAWWVAAANRATAAPYDVHHLGGTTRVVKNQTINGSMWNLLGSFDFPFGTQGKVELSDDVPGTQYVSADAVRLVYASAIEDVVDNIDPEPEFSKVGTWGTSANPGYYGTNSLYHLGDGGASSATWRPNLPYSGRYRVYAWWIVSSNRAHQAPYTINHRGGATTVYANQTDVATIGRWNVLGDFDFNAGTAGSAVLRAAIPTYEYVSADAVRFAYVTRLYIPGDFDGDGDVDLADYAFLADCLAGPGVPPAPTPPTAVEECLSAFDFGADNDVDAQDFAEFQAVFTGQP